MKIVIEATPKEIARLQNSPHVKLYNQERRLRNRRRMYLYQLRQEEKKGKELEEAGITPEVLRSMYDTSQEADAYDL